MRRTLRLLHPSFRSLSHFSQLSSVLGSHQQAVTETWWMVEHITGKKRYEQMRKDAQKGDTQAFPSINALLSPEEQARLTSMLHARAVHRQPLQYLLGSVSFLGLDLLVRPPVLIPRPETECMVGWILSRWSRLDYRAKYGHMSITQETDIQDLMQWTSTKGQRAHGGREQSEAGAAKRAADSQPAAPASASSALPPLRVLDLCSGSGNISLSLFHHFSRLHPAHARVIGVDLNPVAVQLARDNLAALQQQGLCVGGAEASCTFAEMDLLQKTEQEPLLAAMAGMQLDPLMEATINPPAFVSALAKLQSPSSTATSSSPSLPSSFGFNLVVSNPPYIPFSEHAELQEEVREWEDFHALVSGNDGMDVYRSILRAAPSLLYSERRERQMRLGGATTAASSSPPSILDTSGWDVPELVLEIGSAAQAMELTAMLQRMGFQHCTIHHDLADLPRWVAAAREKA